jgi:hypothetical protein
MHTELNVVMFRNKSLAMSEQGLFEVAIDYLPQNSTPPIPPLLHVGLKPNTMLVAFNNPLPNAESAVADNNLPLAMDQLSHLQHCCCHLSHGWKLLWECPQPIGLLWTIFPSMSFTRHISSLPSSPLAIK